MMTFRSSLILACVLGALGCGDDDGGSGLMQGYTECGGLTCQPGQYCEDPRFASCVDGCLSDANCLANQYCDTAAFNPTCQNRMSVPDAGGGTDAGPGDALAECQAACDHFQGCGLPAPDAAQCRTDCNGLTPDQQRAVANCDGVSCVSAPGCLGVDCFSDSDCSGAEECVGSFCL